MESISGRGNRKIYSTVLAQRNTLLTKTGIRKLPKYLYIRTYVYYVYSYLCEKNIGFLIMLCQLWHTVYLYFKKGKINTNMYL